MQNKKMLTAVFLGTAKSFLDRAAYRAHREERKTHRNALLNVLNRAALDETFRTALLFCGTKALEQYELTCQEKTALMSGDIKWIEKNICRLTPDQKSLLLHRLEAEIW